MVPCPSGRPGINRTEKCRSNLEPYRSGILIYAEGIGGNRRRKEPERSRRRGCTDLIPERDRSFPGERMIIPDAARRTRVIVNEQGPADESIFIAARLRSSRRIDIFCSGTDFARQTVLEMCDDAGIGRIIGKQRENVPERAPLAVELHIVAIHAADLDLDVSERFIARAIHPPGTIGQLDDMFVVRIGGEAQERSTASSAIEGEGMPPRPWIV